MNKEKGLNLLHLAEDGWRLMREGKPEKAREVFRQVLEHLPGGRPRARLSYRRKESQIVISRLKHIPEPLSPTETLGLEARLALANCCLECGLVEESIQHLERVVEVCPDRAEAYCDLGEAYQKLGREGLALSALRRALRIDPALPKAHQILAQHFVKLERLGEAQKALRKALRLNPERQDYYVGLAACYVQQGRLAEAWRWLHRAVDKFPEAEEVREALADLCQRLGDYTGLLVHAEALAELNPRNPYAHDLLAMAHFQHGDLDRAMQSLGRLVSLDPLDPVSRLKLALLLQQKGALGRAMEEYERVLFAAPEGEYAQAALEAMETLDYYQMQQILLRASEDKRFRDRLENDLEGTLTTHCYRLTDFAMEALRRWDFDLGPEVDAQPITYH